MIFNKDLLLSDELLLILLFIAVLTNGFTSLEKDKGSKQQALIFFIILIAIYYWVGDNDVVEEFY